jgi:hypothetical protein
LAVLSNIFKACRPCQIHRVKLRITISMRSDKEGHRMTEKTRKRLPPRPAGLKARPQMKMTPDQFTEAVERLKMSVREVAERLDINRATVHGYMSGTYEVTTLVSLAILRLYDEVEKEREKSRRKLKKAGYGDDEIESILAVIPGGIAMALAVPGKGGDDE